MQPHLFYRSTRVAVNIMESCMKPPVPGIELEPMSIVDSKLFMDDFVKCHLVCNQAKLRAAIANVVRNRIRTDVQVVVHGKIFDCHLAVLHVSAEYFKQFTSTNAIIIDEPEVTALGFEKAYEWMVDRIVEPKSKWLIELFLVARYLQMPALTEQLWFCFEDSNNFNEADAFELYIKAIPYSTETLQALLLTRVNRFFLSAVTTREYLELTAEQVYAVLTTCVLAVNSEMEVFMSAFRWMMYDWEDRKRHKLLLMQAVRFNLMPAWYILSLMTKPKSPELAEILDEPSIQDTLNAALSYSVTQHFIHADSPLQKPLELNTEHQREWIVDSNASHHHLYNCPNWEYLDYSVFSLYMDQIISSKVLHMAALKLFKPSNFPPCCRAVVQSCKTLKEM